MIRKPSLAAAPRIIAAHMFNGFSSTPALGLLQREVLVLSRDKRLFGLLSVMTGILVAVTAILLLKLDSSNVAMAGFARNLFRIQFFLLYVAALIIIPGAAATSMVSERRQDCFPLLHTTLIPPGWIVWSKAFAFLGLFGLFFIGLLPFSGIVYFFAGVETAALFQNAIVLFSLALGTSSIGLLASSIAPNHGRALYLTGLGVVAMLGAPFLVHVALRPFLPGVLPWLEFMGPATLFALGSSGMAGWTPSLVFAAYQIGVAAIALPLTRGLVVPDRVLWRERFSGRGARPAGCDPVRHPPTVEDGQNPIAAKDLHVNPLSRGYRPHALGFAGALAGTLLSAPYYIAGGTGVVHFSSLDETILAIVLPPIVALHYIAEREQGTWDNLRATLLSGREVATGKLWGVWLVIRPLILGLLVGKTGLYVTACAASLVVGEFPNPIPVAMGIVSLPITTGTCMVFAFYGAAHRSTTAGAVVMAYVTSFGLPILAMIPIGLILVPFLVATNFATVGTGNSGYFEWLYLLAVNLYYVLLAIYLFRRTAAVLDRKLVAGVA